jgi:hypothetical protein
VGRLSDPADHHRLSFWPPRRARMRADRVSSDRAPLAGEFTCLPAENDVSNRWSLDRSTRGAGDFRPVWLLTFAAAISLSCAQSDVLDFPGLDAGNGTTTPQPDQDGSTTDPTGTPGTGGTGSVQGATGGTTGTGGVVGPEGDGGSTGGGSGKAGNTGTESTGGTSGAAGNHGVGGASGTGGAAGHGSGGVGGHGAGGAGGQGAGGTGGTGIGGNGATAPTFTTIYSEILVVHCAGSNCHKPGTQGGISFATQASAYSAISHQVIPGDGADSDFYVTVDTGVMPKGGPKLSAANLASIKAWIDGGALNN